MEKTFDCYTCHQDVPVSRQVECCGCAQNICVDCNDAKRCACDLLKLTPATALVN
jgi:hypothetical protein